ncbi:MAG: D-2-hydroxyacid dehydrogenase [Planctomycetes bacterium]|nr:D-2-hydroxyacid dehydrogenase [Planctomycetota bacterium]
MQIAVWLVSPTIPGWHFNARQEARLQAEIPGAEITVCKNTDEFQEALQTAEIAMAWRLPKAWLENAPKLAWISTPAAGQEAFSYDLPEGLEITHGAFHGELMGETVVAMMLADCRGITATLRLQDNPVHPWPKTEVAQRMRPLRGSHVVIVGFGHIGKWIGRLVKPFGVRITGIKRKPAAPPNYFDENDRVALIDEIDKILPETDHLAFALPGGVDTNLILDKKRLKLLPKQAVIYNVGRGNCIDEAALAVALKKGKIAAAYLDVFMFEPLPEDSPLRDCPNIMLMPHASAIAPNYLDLYLDEFIPIFHQRYPKKS